MIKERNIWFTLLLAVVFIASLSFVLPKNDEKYLGDMFWTRKTFAPAAYNVILMGDSRMYRGVSPEILEKALPGFKVLNFGYSNGGLNPVMYKGAEEKLTPKEQVKVIVIGVTANTLSDYTINNTQYIQELKRPKEEILERLYLHPISYWFSATSPEKLSLFLQDKNEPKTSWYINNYKMNGYVESEKFPADTTEALASYTKDFNSYKVSQKHTQALFRQTEEWTRKGITVLAFRPPVSKAMYDLENDLGQYNEKIIADGISRAGGRWIELNRSDYKTYDGSHVDRPSAEHLSEKIADGIKKCLAK